MVTIKIGKKGLTDNIIKEINLQLEKRGMVKVKMLRSFRSEKDKRELVDEIKAKVKGKLVDFRGFVLTFERC